jgi:predicted Zn finger-like uncharacterized protein
MKIVCDNCATKYSIADEKVRGKVFKIRCKKCSHVIVVRGNEGGGAEAQGGGGDLGAPEENFGGATVAAASPQPPQQEAGSEAVWHVAIGNEQVGPLTAGEVRSRFAAGEIDAETYGWREGFGDWLRLGSIEEFADLEAAAPARPPEDGATRRTDTADLFAKPVQEESSPSAGADLFGASDARTATGADAFSRAAASEPEASAPPAAVAAAGGDDSPKMTGQRSENSVLFSLNNLQALASNSAPKAAAPAAAAAKPGVDTRPGFANSQTEGSGLIDIRAMAASTLASSSPASPASRSVEPPVFAAAPMFTPMAAPIMMPAAPSGTPKWVWAVVGVGGLAVVSIIVIGVLMLNRKPEIVQVPVAQPQVAMVAAPPTAAPPVAAVPVAAPAAAAAPEAAAPAAAPEAAAPKKSAPADDKKHAASSKHSAGDSKKGSEAKAPAAVSGVVPPPSESPAPAKKASGGSRSSLDDLLDSAAPGSGGKSSKPAHSEPVAAADDNLPDQLGKQDIVNGMGKIKAKVQACYDQFKVPGMVMVAVTIQKSGTVSTASAGGSFAGTPTGGCVEKAVKSATFGKFKGASQSISYPFSLR